MPKAKYTGSPTGSGNPPGKHSGSYLDNPGDGGHFVSKDAYQGNMNVGRNEKAKIGGNQPQERKSSGLITNNPALR